MSADQQRLLAPRRYLSRLTRGTLAVIMAGGRGERLKDLTEDRCKPATPFGGKFRIIDFVLSNCLNSGIRQIAVLSQYKAHSLIQHIQRGWGYLRGEFGEFVDIIPAQQQRGEHWYRGTADSWAEHGDHSRAPAGTCRAGAKHLGCITAR
jgi:glucose-1-phosphate adenylyltransferase